MYFTEGNNRRPGVGGNNFNNDRFNNQMPRKRQWEGNSEGSQAKRPVPSRGGIGGIGGTRFPSATPGGYKNNAYTSNGSAPKPFNNMGGYNNRNVASGQQQPPRTFNKPTSFDQKPPSMSHSIPTGVPPPSVPSNAMAMTYPTNYSSYQPIQYAQYPMAYAFPPPSTSLMPPLPKN